MIYRNGRIKVKNEEVGVNYLLVTNVCNYLSRFGIKKSNSKNESSKL